VLGWMRIVVVQIGLRDNSVFGIKPLPEFRSKGCAFNRGK
jgi:hypothetical protein